MSAAFRDRVAAKELAHALLLECGFKDIAEDQRLPSGIEVSFVAADATGAPWYFDLAGALTIARPGLRRADVLWKALGKSAVIGSSDEEKIPLVFLTTNFPPRRSAGDVALRAARGGAFHDVIDILSIEGRRRLERYATGAHRDEPEGELLTPE